jgi:hypothetical protein
MVDETFFRKNWSFFNVGATCKDVYPDTHFLIIGKDPDPALANASMAVWLDKDGNLHALRKLRLVNEKLTNVQAVELGRPTKWAVTIEQDPNDPEKLKGIVKGPSDFFEASLAGVWGAEAPPPFTDAESQGPGQTASAG